MDFENHLQFLRMCKTKNISKGALLSTIYELVNDHQGKDFDDLDDLFKKLYPDRIVQQVGSGVNIQHRGRSTHQKRRYKNQ